MRKSATTTTKDQNMLKIRLTVQRTVLVTRVLLMVMETETVKLKNAKLKLFGYFVLIDEKI